MRTNEIQDIQDKYRYQYMRDVNLPNLLRMIKSRYDLNFSGVEKLEKLITMMHKRCGRVSSTTLYIGSRSIFTKDEWRMLSNKEDGIIVTLDECDTKKSRQIGIDKKLVFLAGKDREIPEELEPIVNEEKEIRRSGLDPETGEPLSALGVM